MRRLGPLCRGRWYSDDVGWAGQAIAMAMAMIEWGRAEHGIDKPYILSNQINHGWLMRTGRVAWCSGRGTNQRVDSTQGELWHPRRFIYYWTSRRRAKPISSKIYRGTTDGCAGYLLCPLHSHVWRMQHGTMRLFALWSVRFSRRRLWTATVYCHLMPGWYWNGTSRQISWRGDELLHVLSSSLSVIFKFVFFFFFHDGNSK